MGKRNDPSFQEAAPTLFAAEQVQVVKRRRAAPRQKDLSYVEGHRERLKTRFREGGAAAMPDYELLELALTLTHRQGDVKPIAFALLKKFGNLNEVFAAPEARLLEVEGVGPQTAVNLKILVALAHRLARSRILHRSVVSSWDALLEYCHTTMSHRDTEQFRVLYLDRKNVVIADEEQAEGSVDHVPVYPRMVVKRALELNASALILVHNHPSGDPTPSGADIEMTAQVKAAAEALGIVLHDHLVIGKGREVSFRGEGYL